MGLLQVREMSAGEVGGVVKGWERDRLRRELESRSTLQLYRHKIGIGDEGIYSRVSDLMVNPLSAMLQPLEKNGFIQIWPILY